MQRLVSKGLIIMAQDPFNNPASSKFEPKNHKDKLLIITPLSYVTNVQTPFGSKDAVDGRVVILNEQAVAESEVVESGRLFSGPLIGATKPFVGKGMVLGRLRQGQPKPGQEPPWLLEDATDADRQIAGAWLQLQAPSV